MGRIGELLQARASAVVETPSADNPQSRIGAALARRQTTVETLRAPEGVTLSSVFPLTSQFFTTGPLVLPLTEPLIRVGLDVLGLPFRAVGALRETAQTGRSPLQAFAHPRPPESREEAFVNLIGEGILAQPLLRAPQFLGQLAQGARSSRIGRALEARLQATRPITVDAAEQIVRSGSPHPGFARRVAQLSPEQRQELARRLGQVQAPSVEPPRGLTFQTGEGIVAERGQANVPAQPLRSVSPQSALRRPAVEVRPASVSPQALAATHPGLDVAPTEAGQIRLPATQILGDRPELRGVSVIPITRATADSLEGQTVALSPSQFTDRVFRQVPAQFEGLGGATGLQHWYAFDLPPTTGPSYGKRTVPTPSEGIPLHQPPLVAEPQGQYRATQPLVRVRHQAIHAVTRDLVEQSKLLHQGTLDLKQAVLRAGGIKPTVGGQLREELHAIRPFLRSTGQPIDQLATELGFEDGEALREALMASRSQTRPTLAQLRQEAVRIVDSDQGNRILDVIQTQGFTSQAVKRMVREVTRETERVISQGSQAVRGILRRAEQKSITPAQLARLARTQRLEPGATLTGPRGGLKEAPLSQPDIRQVEQRVGQVVPPRGPHVTGTPPKIPTGRSLIVRSETPQEYPYRDLTEFQAAKLSGLEPYRAFNLIDGNRRGPSTIGIYEPTLAVTRAKADEEQIILERLNRLVPNLRAKTPEDTALMVLGENKLSATQITPRLLRAAGEMRETYDRLLTRVNQVRMRNGKLPIPSRQDYMPHLRAQTLMSEVFGGFENIPDDAINVTIGEIHPNSPYAWFQNRREGGPYAKSAVEAYQAWVSKALESIHYPDVIQTVRPRIQNLPPRARSYATEYVDQVLARRPHPTDLIPSPTLLRFIDQQRTRTSQGAVSGNILSFFNQVLTMPATVSSAGPINTTRAVLALSGNAMQRFVNDLAAKVGAQTAAEAILKAHQPDVLNFIEQHSKLIRYRTYDVDFNVKPPAGGKFNPLAAIATAQNAFDVNMVRVAWYAKYLKSARSGVGQEAAIRVAEDVATATNGNFERAALAPVYRSRLAKSVTQFTVSINNVLNYLRFDAGVQPTRLLRAVPQPPTLAPRFVKRAMNQTRLAGERLNPNPSMNPHTLKQLLFFIGTAVGLNALITNLKLPIKQTGASDILPGIGALQGQVPATYALPVALGQRLMAKQPQDVSKADAAIWRSAWLQVRYGNQIRKTIEGLMAVARGGSFTAAGRQRFPIQGGAEKARALAFGPYGTEKGQAYIQRGFKPEPLTEEQKRVNRAMRNYERSLMR